MTYAEISSRMALVMAMGLVASLYAWGWIASRWWRLGQVIEYEPRQRLPWKWGGVLPAILLTSIAVLGAVTLKSGNVPDEPTASEFASSILATSAIYLFFSVAIVAVLVLLVRASWRDLGWPTSVRQFFGDVGLGVGLALASLLPIYVVQLAAMKIPGFDTTRPAHPLLRQLYNNPDPLIIFAAIFAAVVVAPLFEELLFRLLLQGGLERLEDDSLSRALSPSPLAEEQYTGDEQPPSLEDTNDPASTHQHAPGAEHLREHHSPVELQYDPLARGPVVGLRHGWAPILASSFLFALAHLGQGTGPIALFVFAMFLGFAYQRTHRIVPSIIAHLVFNLISVSMMVFLYSPQ